MRRILVRLVLAVLAALMLVGAFLVTLAVTTPDARDAPGWERLPDMPEPRGEAAAGVAARVDDCEDVPVHQCTLSPVRLFVVGGMSGRGTASRAVSVFDPDGARWSAGPPLPEARHHVAAAGTGGVLYVAGGATGAGSWTPKDSLWALLPTETTWRTLPPMPEPRLGHAMAAVDASLFVVGGRGRTSNVLIFDTREERWRIGAEMPEARDHLAIAVVGTKIYALGGRSDGLSARVDVYDTELDAWSEGPRLPMAMSAMAAGALPDGIHVVGGEDPSTIGGKVFDEHFVLRPGADSWSPAPPPIVPTHGSAYAVLDDMLIVAGGSRRPGAMSPLGWTGVAGALAPAS